MSSDTKATPQTTNKRIKPDRLVTVHWKMHPVDIATARRLARKEGRFVGSYVGTLIQAKAAELIPEVSIHQENHQ